MTFPRVLQKAGYETVLKRVKVIKTASGEGKPKTVKLNLKEVMNTGQINDDIELVNGDVVVVPTTIWGHISIFIRAVFSPVVRVAKWAV